MKKKRADSAPVDAVVRPGSSYHLFFNVGNINNNKIHIRAIVDCDWVVFRSWSKRKQQWFYQINHMYFFELLHRDGYLKKV